MANVNFYIYNESLEWYKKCSKLAKKKAIKNNSDALGALHLKWKKLKVTQSDLF